MHSTARRGITLITAGAATLIVLAFNLAACFTPADAGRAFAAALCGEGSPPDYGFTYDLQQAHWTVNWQDYASEKAVTEVDRVLDRLNGDFIAQTMILIQPQEQVGNRVNCAVHFLRYMKLGLLAGERKDNGFVFLIVVEPTRIDVHYGVGLGLPALTAPELTSLNRAAEAAYQSTHSMDDALLALVQGFDTVTRSKYAPLILPTPVPGVINQQPLPTELPLPTGPLGILTLCGGLCLGFFILLFLVWVLFKLARNGISFNPSRFGSSGGSFPFGGGGSPMRGGGGSGRSGRGN